jgi:alkylated DNA repair dioxygenase AlkB
MKSEVATIQELQLQRNYLDPQQADHLLDQLVHDVDWHADYYEAFGRRFEIPRLQAWFADTGIQYSYSNNLLPVQQWPHSLLALKQTVEATVGHRFNAVLVTYYRHGDDHVTWHADDERELGDQPVIASLSLGATRQFCYRNKATGESHSLALENGDLVLMLPEFQHHWQHCVPVEAEVREPRINLTFRNVVNREMQPRE